MASILLIEDNELNRDMLSRRLARRGHEVKLAENAETGLSLAATLQPELILMDLNLPVLDGWEATRRLKADAATRSIPVIALTAHAMGGDRERALQAGCADYVSKPIDLVLLLAKIDQLLANAGT